MRPGDSSSLRRKWRTARHQPVVMLPLVALAWIALGLAAASLRVVPFKRIAALLGRNLGATLISPAVSPGATRRAALIARALAIAANNAPFRADCLPQALAAILLCRLGGIPYAAHLGVAKSEQESRSGMSAHAWVTAGPVAVSGGRGSQHRFKPVACFVSREIARCRRAAADD